MTFSITHKKTLTIQDDPAAEAAGLVLPSNWNDTLNAVMASGYLLGRSTAGDGPVQELDAAAARDLLGIILGASAGNVPVLNGSGKLSTSILPESIVGAMKYKGGWNASTNSPAIPAASAANLGWYYIVTTAGTTTVSGVSDWQVGDWIVSNGTSWDKVDSSDQVNSVAGLTGPIPAAALRVALSLVVGTDVQAFSALLSQIAALNLSGQNGKVLGVSGGALALVSGGGSVKVQTGYIDTTSITSAGVGEDYYYINVVIAAVADITKCDVSFVGGAADNNANNIYTTMSKTGNTNSFHVTARLTSITNLRLSLPVNVSVAGRFSGRWYVREFN